MRSQLADAFEESLQVAPDPADVLVGIHGGIERRRRRQRLYRTGGAAAAVVLAMIASTITVIAIRSDSPPVGGVDPAPVGEWTSLLQVGWVPEAWSLRTIRSTEFSDMIVYTAADVGWLHVTLAKVDPPPRRELPGSVRTEINGQPASEHTQDGARTVINWQLPSGRWAEVEIGWPLPLPENAQFRAPEFARRIAESVRDSDSTLLSAGFAPTYLPDGQRVIGVAHDPVVPAGRRRTVLCASGLVRPARDGPSLRDSAPEYAGPSVQISIDPLLSPGVVDEWIGPANAERLPDIQGRPAYRLSRSHGVVVTDFHGGVLSVSSPPALVPDGPAPVPDTELIKIAEGVRWVG